MAIFPKYNDQIIGKEATKLYNDANALLDQLVAEKWLTAKELSAFLEAAKSSGR